MNVVKIKLLKLEPRKTIRGGKTGQSCPFRFILPLSAKNGWGRVSPLIGIGRFNPFRFRTDWQVDPSLFF